MEKAVTIFSEYQDPKQREEVISVLLAISKVSKRLAGRLAVLGERLDAQGTVRREDEK